MKTLLKIFLILFVLTLLLVGAGIFVLTRPGVQKKIIVSQLPEGSSLRTVRVTTSSLELSELKLALPDGTQVRLGSLNTDFKVMDALFNNTVKLGALNVDGLVVEIPTALIQGSSSDPSTNLPGTPSKPSGSYEGAPKPAMPSTPATDGSPMDALYAAGQFDWLLDIDSISLEGELRDAAGSTYAIDLTSGAIRPGQETTIEASLKLRSREALHAGLKEFDASTRIFLKQNIDGGFEQVRIESSTNASDQTGNNLLTVSQQLDLATEAFGERASVKVEFNADLPRPEIFLSEMSGVGAINVQGSLEADAVGDELTLSRADLLLSSAGAELVSVKLNKNFTLGGKKDLSGNLMDLRVTNLPVSWLGPWLPEGLVLSGNDVSAQFNLTGLAGGALRLSPTVPLRLGPLSLSRNGLLMLDQVTILAQPVIRFGADQSISWDLSEFQIQDRYGEIISGQSTGRYNPSASSEGFLPAGLSTQTKLDIGLQQITQQPVFAEYASILSGRAKLDLDLDSAGAYPLKAQGRIDGISPRAYPGQRQDYRFTIQLKEPDSGALALDANLQAGSVARPSSNLQFTGQVRPGVEPLEFKADLVAQRVSQGDIEMLKAAFQAEATPSVTPARPFPPPPVATPKPPVSPAPKPSAVVLSDGPPWAAYNGEVNLSIAELYLLSGEVLTGLRGKAVISEPLLRVSDLEASLLDGKISGGFETRYSKSQRMAYAIETDLSFDNVDPAVFAMKRTSTFPVKGLFEGRAQFAGQGATLEQAVDAIQGEFLMTGKEGVLTAFKLDTRSSLGIIGAGLLGQQLNRPGITALAQAVPYFENMPFSDFTLKLTRGVDKHIMIPQLEFVGRNLLINGSGSIAATRLKDAMNQPLDLKLELGTKGKLIDSLETLELLGPNTAEDGYRRWKNEIQIKGTLREPDTSALERVLKDAANRALREPSKKKEEPVPEGADAATAEPSTTGEGQAPLPPEEEPKLSKEEKILRDVGTGLDILFGR